MGRGAALAGRIAPTCLALAGCGGASSSLSSADASTAHESGSGAAPIDAAEAANDASDAGDEAACASGGGPGDGAMPQLEAGACQNGWLTSDPACPCELSGFSAPCPAAGTRCYVPASGQDAVTTDQICKQQNGDLLWVQYALYSPAEFAALPHEIDLDISDCSSRTTIPCECGPGETTEGWLDSQVLSLTQCTYGNPFTYFAFDDDGCVSQIRYSGTPTTSNFGSCLQNALATVRWACASSGTHFIDRRVVAPLGGP
jgi:hypothetical protein